MDATTPTLSPSAVIADAFQRLIAGRRRLVKLIVIPFLLLVMFNLTLRLVLDDWLYGLVQVPLILVLQTCILVAVHRLVLLGEDAVGTWGLTAWTARETRFALHLFLAGLALAVPTLLQIIPVIGGIASLVFALWLAARIGLVFPAIAIGHRISLVQAWRLSESHQWQLFLILGAALGGFFLSLGGLFTPLIIALTAGAGDGLVFALLFPIFALTLLLYGCFLIFAALAISICYRAILLKGSATSIQ